MRAVLLLAPLSLFLVLGAAPGGEPEKRADISVKLAIQGEKDGVERAKKLQAALKELGVTINDLRIHPSSPSSADLQFDSKVPPKQVAKVVEILLEHDVRVLQLVQTKRPIVKVPAETKKLNSFGDASLVFLIQTGTVNDQWYAIVRNRIERDTEWKISNNDVFRVQRENKGMLTLKVIRVELRRVILLEGKNYYSVALGGTIEQALEQPLDAERVKELKLPSP